MIADCISWEEIFKITKLRIKQNSALKMLREYFLTVWKTTLYGELL